jgi:hypothetical protein
MILCHFQFKNSLGKAQGKAPQLLSHLSGEEPTE